MKLILASTSPRRRELLQELNIPFEIVAPRFEEHATKLPPREEALLFAREKAQSVVADHPKSLILASDTLVALNGIKLGKPTDPADAERMLNLLSGRKHFIYTAVALLNTDSGETREHVEEVTVRFRPLNADEIAAYIATGEPFDKAGAYAIQGGAKDFVTHVDGDLNAVIGLPLAPLQKWLTNSS